MAVVMLRAPLSQRAGGTREHDVPGSTVGEVLRELERRHPSIVGWILDERGVVRPHVNVFVTRERTRESSVVEATDILQVLPAISGG
jgi:sulfur-carrier protein